MIPPSYCATVWDVLRLVRDVPDVRGDHPNLVQARKSITTTRPYAVAFMAWQLYYRSPTAKRDAFAAMNGE